MLLSHHLQRLCRVDTRHSRLLGNLQTLSSRFDIVPDKQRPSIESMGHVYAFDSTSSH